MAEGKEIEGKFRFERDTKRFHRFQVEFEENITGTIYISKDIEPMPKKLILTYAEKRN